MHRSIPLLLLAGALMLPAGIAHAKPSKDPEAEIARIVADREVGTPVNCIQQHQINSSQIVSRTAIVYKMNNGTVYVNRPVSGKNFLRRGDALVTDTHSSQLCNVDIVRLLDASLHAPTGTVGLGQFVPYTRTPRSAAR